MSPVSLRAAAALSLLALPVSAQEVTAPERFLPLRAEIEARIEAGEVPSLALAVVASGELVWAEGFGIADREAGRAASADTVYSLASVTKPLLASGVMALVEAGRLELDAPVNGYLGDAPLVAHAGAPEAITLRRLLGHTAGLSEHWSFFHAGTAPPPRERTIARYGFAYTPPGTRWEYSNLGYGVLDHVVSRTSGEPWADFLGRALFTPLGMERTGEGVPAEYAEDAAARYGRDVAGRFVRLADYGFDHPGASALWSSARDLARFARMHLAGGELEGARVLAAESVAEMQRRSTDATDSPRSGRSGIGWFVDELRGARRVHHSGGMPGVATCLWLFPDHGAAVVVLANAGSPWPRELAGRVSELLFDGAASEEPAKDAESSSPPPDFRGTWRGSLHHHDGPIELALEVGESIEATRIAFGRNDARALEGVRVAGGSLYGSVDAPLACEDGYHGPMELRLRLDRRGERLTGVCIARAEGHFARAHFVELRAEGAPAPGRFAREGAPALSFLLPAGWKSVETASSMRLAQYRLPGEGEVDCVVYWFGAGGGGGLEANVARWLGQLEREGEPRIETLEIAPEITATLVDASGTYVAETRPGSGERHHAHDQRLLAAYVDAPLGPLYVKLVGPRERIDAAAFRAWIASFQAAP